MKKNKIVNFLPYISILIFLILAIPFSFKEYSQVEWIVKMYALPIIIITIFIIFTVQRLKKLDDNKFEILGNTIPVLLYISGTLIYFVTITTRTSELSIVNDLTIYLIILVITLSLSIILFFEELADKKKNVAIIFTIVNAVLIMCIVGYGIIFLPNKILSDSNMIPVDYEGLKLNESAALEETREKYNKVIRSPFTTLYYKKGVCVGVSGLFNYLCSLVDVVALPAYCSAKQIDFRRKVLNNHQISKIYLKNNAYYFDPTFDLDAIEFEFFGKNKAEISNTHFLAMGEYAEKNGKSIQNILRVNGYTQNKKGHARGEERRSRGSRGGR